MKKAFMLILFFLVFVISCAPQNLRTYKPLDKKEHSITVPAGSLCMVGDIKDVLIKNGWKLYIDNDTTNLEGNADRYVKLTGKKKLKTKYQLFIYCRQIGYNYYNYNISIVDNDGEEEVMSLNGEGYPQYIAGKFEEWLTTGTIATY